MTQPKFEVQNVSLTFHEGERPVEALRAVSFAAMPGEFMTVIGPSGSGKTSLLNVIAGLRQPDAGQVLIDGQPAPDRLGQFGYMPQRDLLLPWRSVLDNVVLPLEIAGVPKRQAYARAREMLPIFGLAEFAQAYPAALSGGMRQRAALLRTLLGGQAMLLLDEPFGALDALTRRQLQDWLLDLWQGAGQTVLFVTHDVEEALYLGDRVLILSARPGQVVDVVKVDLPRPRRRAMLAEPAFSRQMAALLAALGVPL